MSAVNHEEAILQDLRGRLPRRVVDVHAHLYRLDQTHFPPSYVFSKGAPEQGLADWRRALTSLLGPREMSGMFIPFPSADGDLAACNRYVADQIASLPDARSLMLVRPDLPREAVEETLRNPRIIGFKPYHFYSPSKPTVHAPLLSFVPEWMWQIAGERGLVITLHMVRPQALADEDNWRTIRTMLERYPGARVVLAHAARGFAPVTVARGIRHLAGLDNVWFDTAAICEPEPFLTLLEHFGPRRLMFGSDFPISELLGKCVGIADAFAWLYQDTLDWKAQADVAPVRIGAESLRALVAALDQFSASDEDMQDIFADNARRLMGVQKESGKTQATYKHACTRIPGGVQLLSKRPEMFAPGQWPPYFREARGCEMWDLDGKRYIDMSLMGIGSCLLGFRDPDVTRAVLRRVRLGAMSTVNPPEEVALADLLCELHPWASQARFVRCGGEAMAVAARIARATTNRSKVAICGYHGWQDWYLAANLASDRTLDGHLLPGLQPSGVPRELVGTTLTFHFNDQKEFDAVMDAHDNELAAVIMEPCRNVDPIPGFLERVRERTKAAGAMWVIDEITAGFRMHLGGAHLRYGVTPDMAVFAKAMGNGHPIGAVIGTPEAMSGAHGSFISSTYWTESVGPTAAVATISKMRRIDVPKHVEGIGRVVMNHWDTLGKKHGLPVEASGFPCLSHFAFIHPKADALRTLYAQWMLDRGFLGGVGFYPSLAHTPEIVAAYGKAIDEVFAQIADVLRKGEPEKHLRGAVAHTGFRRLT